MNTERDTGPFSLTPANLLFAVLPGLVLMFTLAPALSPAVPLAFSGFFSAFVGAILGLLVYRQVKEYGPLARIGALTLVLVLLWGGATLLTR